MDHDLIPTAVFSQPSIGTCGLTEEAARQRHKNIDIYKADFRPMKHTLSGREERMLMKLIVDADSDKVLGCHILGADAGEIIQGAWRRHQNGRHQGGFRRHHGGASDGGGRICHHARKMDASR